MSHREPAPERQDRPSREPSERPFRDTPSRDHPLGNPEKSPHLPEPMPTQPPKR